MKPSPRLEALGRAFWVALIPGAILFLAMQTFLYSRANMIGADSHAYWMAARFPSTWYAKPPLYRDAYLYSPAFAQVLWPLGQLSWPVFQSIWITGQVSVLAWLLAPLGWRRSLTVAPFCIPDLLLGNVYVFFAGALVVSLGRAPGAQALPVLTKVTPGVVVSAWFVVRRQWRAASWAAGTTLAIAAVSVAINPLAWLDWARFLVTSASEGDGTMILRFVIGLGVAIWAAKAVHPWLLAPALILTLPLVGGWVPFAALAAIPRLHQLEGTDRNAQPVSRRPPVPRNPHVKA